MTNTAALAKRLERIEAAQPDLPFLVLREVLDSPGQWSTHGEPRPETYTDDDLPTLGTSYRLILITYEKNWREVEP